MKARLVAAVLAATLSASAAAASAQTDDGASARWTPEHAKAWYAAQPRLLGANYVPASAINELEMWQAQTFDPQRIGRELVWAEQLHMNTMRVFLHDLPWKQDPQGFSQRIDTFLSIAHRHGIRPIFVLFDSCWDPAPRLGRQPAPLPGVHNSGWVQSPGRAALGDPAQTGRLKAYVEGVVGAFGHDERVLAWDVWNEPDNTDGGRHAVKDSPNKKAQVARLMPQVFAWARARSPIQPLTSGLWVKGDWSVPGELSIIEKIQLAESDIVSFHDYSWPETFEKRILQLQTYGRPIICTEYMARGAGSTFDNDLPIARKYDVGMINWGFVDGKEQTRLPWDSWKRPYVGIKPTLWFHDVLHSDGTPYRQREAELLQAFGAK